ncbi:hypothetical protein [Nocardioides mesophilus]|uniref:DUF2867 domain-containing protein n=1 Tax=Nocardioides mesophilus TaxID=433659 RepID=A0A7G9R6F3_9ACTN|nr:hypothetical protein [Nocardioides mesophilus]QNN51178.1 hypothetical protein H9L09_10980 [Nocardioides mesophilus]
MSAEPDDAVARGELLLDVIMPRYDVAVVHARVFRVPPRACYDAIVNLDVYRSRLVHALISLRGLPPRLATRLRGDPDVTGPDTTFRLRDLTERGWLLLGERPGAELVLGQVSRPWRTRAAAPTVTPSTPAAFTAFDQPGFAKITASFRVDPYGRGSILTAESRVQLTDAASRKRFRRYWVVVGPFSHLIRRIALRLVSRDLRTGRRP